MGHVSVEYQVEDSSVSMGDHCTLFYLGETDIDGRLQEHTLGQIWHCLKEADFATILSLKVEGFDFFGPLDDVPVIRLESTDELVENRRIAEECLNRINVVNGSQYVDFNPHVTIKNYSVINPKNFPKTIYFNGLYLSWNNAQYRID